MENGIYIYNHPELLNYLIKDKVSPIKKRLEQTAVFFYRTWGVKIYFCRLFGRRWSYYAGIDDVLAPEKKIIINNNFGIIIMNNVFSDQQWDYISSFFAESIFKELDNNA